MHIRLAVTVVLALGCLVTSSPVYAETFARSFEALRTQERPGRLVRLFDTSGRQTIGRIAEISASEIALDVEDYDKAIRRVTFTEQDVRQISGTRSRWIGPLVGLATGLLIATQLCRMDWECGNKSRTNVSPMHVSGPLMMASLAGGPALGYLLDRPGLNRILYRAPEPGRASDAAAPPR